MFWGLLMDAGTAEGSGTGTKTALTLTFLVLWGAGLVWMHKDAVYARLPGGVIDAFMAGGMAAGFIFFFATTNEALATTILSLFLATEIGMYLLLRNQTVGLDRLTAGFGGGIGWGGGGKTKGGLAGATTVVLLEKSGEAMAMPAGSSPMRAGYDALQNLLALPLDKNAGYIELKPADGAAERKFFVDGVGYRAEAMTRTAAAAVVGLVKQLAGLDQNEKRKPQTGSMKVVVGGKRKELRVETSGSAAGEELSITVDPKSQHLRRLEELGFDVDQLTQVKGMIAENGGMVLVATPKGQGMDSILYAMLREHNAFLSQIHTIEADTDTELEGVVQHRLSAGTNGAEAAKMVQLLTHQQADVVMASNVDSGAGGGAGGLRGDRQTRVRRGAGLGNHRGAGGVVSAGGRGPACGEGFKDGGGGTPDPAFVPGVQSGVSAVAGGLAQVEHGSRADRTVVSDGRAGPPGRAEKSRIVSGLQGFILPRGGGHF